MAPMFPRVEEWMLGETHACNQACCALPAVQGGGLSLPLLSLFPWITPLSLECQGKSPRAIACCAQGLEIPLLGPLLSRQLKGSGRGAPSCPEGAQAPGVRCMRQELWAVCPGHLAKCQGFRNSRGLRGTATSGPTGPTSTIWMGTWGTP